MILSVPLWVLSMIFNGLIVLPLDVVGSALISSDWVNDITFAIIYVLRPLLYFQGIINTDYAYKTIGWCSAIFAVWLVWLAAKMFAGYIRGHEIRLNPDKDQNYPPELVPRGGWSKMKNTKYRKYK